MGVAAVDPVSIDRNRLIATAATRSISSGSAAEQRPGLGATAIYAGPGSGAVAELGRTLLVE
jgi:hypothetical protein